MAPGRSKKKITTKITAFKQVVNTVTSYEALIAKKLEQLPVPDMADSIWADIAAQLDVPPAGDGGQGPAQPGRGLPGMGKGFFVLCTAVAIVVALWLLIRTKNTAKENVALPTLPETVTVDTTSKNQPAIVPAEKKLPPVQVAPVKKDTAAALDTAARLRQQLNPAVDVDKPVRQPDSALLLNKSNTKPVLDTAAAPLPKKPKGVKGIGDNDYRIQGIKKDSAKKGG
jgi:hypothetical protein